MTFRQRIDTTYADLRPSDLVIDKSGQAWPLDKISSSEDGTTIFWLCDPVSKVMLHLISKQSVDAVKVSRLPTHADEASKLEADFPNVAPDGWTGPRDADGIPLWTESPGTFASMSEAVAAVEEIGGTVEADFPQCEHEWTDSDPAYFTEGLVRCRQCGEVQPRGTLEAEFVKGEVIVKREDTLDVTMAEAVAAVEAIGGTVEAEVTAAEVDAAAAATDDAPVSLPPFADMTPLEQRSHLYLLHGLYGSDVTGRAELIAIHEQAHAQHDAGTLNSRHVPHVHEVA